MEFAAVVYNGLFTLEITYMMTSKEFAEKEYPEPPPANKMTFMASLIDRVQYWQQTAKEKGYTADEALESLGFSICTMIDGTSEYVFEIRLCKRDGGHEQDVDHELYFPMLRAIDDDGKRQLKEACEAILREINQ